jgi:hypothetical protein
MSEEKVRCRRCKAEIFKSELCIKQDGTAGDVCIPCQSFLRAAAEKKKLEKSKAEGGVPFLATCNRCKKNKVWPLDFIGGGNTCTICSNYIQRTGLESTTPESYLKSKSDWKKRNPDKVEEYNKRRKEKKKRDKLKNPEKFNKIHRERMKKCRARKKALKEIEKIQEEENKKKKLERKLNVKRGDWTDKICYYVSSRHGDENYVLLVGPFQKRKDALPVLLEVIKRVKSEDEDDNLYDVCKRENGYKTGSLNEEFGLNLK